MCSPALSYTLITSGNDALQYLTFAGLTEIRRVELNHEKIKLTMSVLLPIPEDKNDAGTKAKKSIAKFSSGEIVIALVDSCSIESVLRMCSKESISIPLKSIGLVSEEISVLPIVLELTMKAVEAISDLLIPQPLLTSNGTVDSNSTDIIVSSSHRQSLSGRELPLKIRVLGHSVSGAVGAYLSMLLDGALSASLERAAPILGLYHDRVRCITLASPPCISRTVVPRFITSLICGDDIICRAHHDSLKYMKRRILSSLKTSSSLIGFIPGSTFLADMAAVAGKGVASYTGNKHDLESVHIPGRVFFMKNRKHKNGASFQRVLRGNWQEDMLWSLRDILLSSRMFEHHDLKAYIATLMRC